MNSKQTRRAYLLTLGLTSTVGLSGCLQGNLSQQQTETEGPSGNIDEANFSFEYAAEDQQVVIEFRGSAEILAGDLQVRSSTGSQTEWAELGSTVAGPEERIRQGATAILGSTILNWDQPVSRDETIRLVYMGKETPATLGRFSPPESSTVTSTTPETDSNTTDSGTTDSDTTVPSITVFRLSNPSGQILRTSLKSDEQLSTIQISISGPEAIVLTTNDFSEMTSNGSYTYEATHQASSDGEYRATLDEASDEAGDNGASGQSVGVSVDTRGPRISSLSVSNPTDQDVRISFNSSELLSEIQVSISGETEATLNTEDFTESDNEGVYDYESSYDVGSAGDYTITVDVVVDEDGNRRSPEISNNISIGSSDDIPDVLKQDLPDPEDYIGDGDRSNYPRKKGTVYIDTMEGTLTLEGPGSQQITAIAGYLSADDLEPVKNDRGNNWGKTVENDSKLIGTNATFASDRLTFDPDSFEGVALRAVESADLIIDGETVVESNSSVRYDEDVGVFEED